MLHRGILLQLGGYGRLTCHKTAKLPYSRRTVAALHKAICQTKPHQAVGIFA